MNVLVTVDRRCLKALSVMVKSLVENTRDTVHLYVMHRSLTEEDLKDIKRVVPSPRLVLHNVPVTKTFVKHAPTSRRYPVEIYDRLFAAWCLPEEVHRILYLDPDLVVVRPIDDLWNVNLHGNLFAAASHVDPLATFFNDLRLCASPGTPYLNSGVLLMDLDAIRKRTSPKKIQSYIAWHTLFLALPDQDVLSALYGRKTLLLDPTLYNMTERLYRKECMRYGKERTEKQVFSSVRIVHYVGRNKPWKDTYRGDLDVFWKRYENYE